MKVRIKEWGELAEEFEIDKHGDIKCYGVFVSGMREYCGKIIEVDTDRVSSIKGVFEYDDWTFSDDMYEIVEE